MKQYFRHPTRHTSVVLGLNERAPALIYGAARSLSCSLVSTQHITKKLLTVPEPPPGLPHAATAAAAAARPRPRHAPWGA